MFFYVKVISSGQRANFGQKYEFGGNFGISLS